MWSIVGYLIYWVYAKKIYILIFSYLFCAELIYNASQQLNVTTLSALFSFLEIDFVSLEQR